MKKMTFSKMLMLCLVMIYGNVSAAWAASAAREDNSDLFVWIFFAFCALIVVAQLIPATMMVLGLAKGIKKKTLQTAPVPVDQDTIQD